jgi:hypothetical protein
MICNFNISGFHIVVLFNLSEEKVQGRRATPTLQKEARHVHDRIPAMYRPQ